MGLLLLDAPGRPIGVVGLDEVELEGLVVVSVGGQLFAVIENVIPVFGKIHVIPSFDEVMDQVVLRVVGQILRAVIGGTRLFGGAEKAPAAGE